MINIKILNTKTGVNWGTLNWNQSINEYIEPRKHLFGKSERWVIENSEYYEDSDVLETEERKIPYVAYEVNEQGHTIEVEKERIETWVLLKADYTIEIIDLDNDYDWLLSECHRKRKAEYPPITELGDALYWKENGNESKYIEYIGKCDAVKKKYPLPTRSK